MSVLATDGLGESGTVTLSGANLRNTIHVNFYTRIVIDVYGANASLYYSRILANRLALNVYGANFTAHVIP